MYSLNVLRVGTASQLSLSTQLQLIYALHMPYWRLPRCGHLLTSLISSRMWVQPAADSSTSVGYLTTPMIGVVWMLFCAALSLNNPLRTRSGDGFDSQVPQRPTSNLFWISLSEKMKIIVMTTGVLNRTGFRSVLTLYRKLIRPNLCRSCSS